MGNTAINATVSVFMVVFAIGVSPSIPLSISLTFYSDVSNTGYNVVVKCASRKREIQEIVGLPQSNEIEELRYTTVSQ